MEGYIHQDVLRHLAVAYAAQRADLRSVAIAKDGIHIWPFKRFLHELWRDAL